MKNYHNVSSDVYSDIISAPDEIGTPVEDAMSAPGPQERADSCAIRAQQHVLSMYGINVSETDLVNDAIEHGEYGGSHDGTALDDVGNLLERNGLEIHKYEGATLAHLIAELAQGHKIIVGIDADEVIASSMHERMVEKAKDIVLERPNHAVVVSNVDPDTLDVDIVDPADGKLHRIPARVYMDSWRDSGCFMVATNTSPSEFLNGNDYNDEQGSLSSALNSDSEDSPIRMIDLDGDGLSDVIGFDYNGDGTIDEYYLDSDHDGIPDVGVGGFQNIDAMPELGGLGHVSGLREDAMPELGGLGHVSGLEEDEMPELGGLGHVSGLQEDAMPELGGLGHVSGLSGEDIMPELGGLGHVSGLDPDNMANTFETNINGDGALDTIGIDIDGDGIIDKILPID